VIPRYEQLLKLQPDLKIVRYKLGQAFYHTGDYPAALSEFKTAVHLAETLRSLRSILPRPT